MNTKTETLHNQEIRLSDGRILAYAEYGDSTGNPVFYFHGYPSSRLEATLIDAGILTRLNARIIAPDRPGIGFSDFKSNRQTNEWSDDIVELADALHLDNFAVLGFSAGGKYAAACAANISQRLTTAGVVSSVGPLNVPGATDDMEPSIRQLHKIAGKSSWLVRLVWGLQANTLRHDPNRFIAQIESSLPEPDKVIFALPEVKPLLIENFQEAFRFGARGTAWEAVLLARPWGFQLENIAMKVYLWHGMVDRNAPLAMGRYQANAIPNCEADFYENEGHFSLFGNHIEEILEVLIA